MRSPGRLLWACLIPVAARAQTGQDQWAKCATVDSPIARLSCYDSLAKISSVSTEKSDTGKTVQADLGSDGRILGNWIMSMKADPITDQKGVTFALPAENATRIDTPTLVIRCVRGDLDVLISPDAYLARNSRVTYRFGTEAPINETWSPASSQTALFVPGSREKLEVFIRKLERYDRFAIQVQPYEKAPLAMVFDLDGITQVTTELWQVCTPRTAAPTPSDQQSSTGPSTSAVPPGMKWIGDQEAHLYYPADCPAGLQVPSERRLYYQSEKPLKEQGFKKGPGC